MIMLSELYKQRAEALTREAAQVSDPLERKALLILAKAWTKMAENEESLEQE